MSVLRNVAVALSVIITLFASAIWALMLSASLSAAVTLTCIGVSGLILCILANLLRCRRAEKSMIQASAEDHIDTMLRERDTVRADRVAARRSAVLTLHLCRLYSCLLLLFGFFLSLGASGLLVCAFDKNSDDRILVTVFSLAVALVVYILVMFIPMMTLVKAPNEEKNTDDKYILRTQTPLLYELADKAAVVAGYHGRFHLMRTFGLETAFSVKRGGEGVAIYIPVAILPVLTKEEIFAVLLHEFAHVIHRDTALSRRFEIALMRYDCEHDRLATFKKLLFSYAEMRLSLAWDRYRNYASLLIEQDADRVAIAGANAQAWINACAKCDLAASILRPPCRVLEYDLLEQENPVADYYERIAAYLEERFRTEEAHFHPILVRTLAGRSDTHPTLKMRMESAHTADYDASRREKDAAFRREIGEETARCSEYACRSFSADGAWEKLREEMYLSHNRIIAEYERARKHGSVDEYLYTQALHAYFIADQSKVFDVAEHALADASMRTDAESVSALLLCFRDHPAAVDATIHVFEENPLVGLQPGLKSILNVTAQRTGDETLVARVRDMDTSVLQEILDFIRFMNDASKLTPSENNILPCDLSQARLAQMSAVLLRLCGDVHAYLVKLRAERPMYAILLDERPDRNETVSDENVSLLNDYCIGISRIDEIYSLYHEKSGTPTIREARKIGIRLT